MSEETLNRNSRPLNEEVVRRMIPTPTATTSRNATARRSEGSKPPSGGTTITDFVTMFPTPRTTGIDGGSNSRKRAVGDGVYIGAKLNPEWVEWLMGWPIGWTSRHPLGESKVFPLDVEPEISRTTDVIKDRAARLKAIGNGQVSLCAAEAWKRLVGANA